MFIAEPDSTRRNVIRRSYQQTEIFQSHQSQTQQSSSLPQQQTLQQTQDLQAQHKLFFNYKMLLTP